MRVLCSPVTPVSAAVASARDAELGEGSGGDRRIVHTIAPCARFRRIKNMVPRKEMGKRMKDCWKKFHNVVMGVVALYTEDRCMLSNILWLAREKP